MKKVFILPTPNTIFGIENKYDILNAKTREILQKGVFRSELEDVVRSNKYKVIAGKKYLCLKKTTN